MQLTKKKALSNLMNKSSLLNNLNYKRNSYNNFIHRGNLGVGLNAFKGFKNNYFEDLYRSKYAPSLHRDNINQLNQLSYLYFIYLYNFVLKFCNIGKINRK